MAENLLGNESFIEKIVSQDANLATKVFRKITDLKGVFARLGNSQAQAEHKRLVKAEKLWLNAAQKAGVDLSRKILNDDEEGIDNESEVKYSKKKKSYYNQFNTLALSWASRAETGSLHGFYDSKGLYQIVEATGDDNVYSIIRSIPQRNTALIEYYEEFIDENNEQINRNAEEVSRIAQSIEDSKRLNDYDSVDVARGLTDSKIRKMGEKQSRSNGNGNIEESSRNSRGQFSLKDSAGNTLTQEQAEFFKDSKVRDENGNLLVVYHGSDADFTVFDKNKIGQNYSQSIGGFFFTDKQRSAEFYGGKDGKIYKTYLNITNPYVVEADSDYFGSGADKFDFQAEAIIDTAKSNGKDGVIVKHPYTSLFVVFSPNQIKLTTNKKPTSHEDIRFSLKDTTEQDVKEHFGTTYNWKETGYILQDGSRLDLSGRHEGASGGYRSVDHREIFDIYEDGDIFGSEALVEFMGRGNIRVMPENPGINLQVEPNAEQYRLIQDLVERLGFKEKYFAVDIDNEYGETIDSRVYEGAVSGRKVVTDLKHFFKEGSFPRQSELSKFRYSLKENQIDALKNRGVKGNALLDAQDLAEEILSVKGEITQDAKAVVYHATSKENADKIIASGKMYGKEDNLFFSTKEDGEILGYGNTVVQAEIPLEKLKLNDVFDDEVHLTMSVKPNTLTNIKFSLKGQANRFADIDEYTEKEYDAFGWARVNGVLSVNENRNFQSKYRQLKLKRNHYYIKTVSGEIIVPVNDMIGGKYGVDNVLVFAKGSAANYKITRVIRINLDSEDLIKIVREDICKNEQRESTYQTSLFWENLYGEEFICQHEVDAFGSYQRIKDGRWRPGSRADGRQIDKNGQLLQNGNGTSSKTTSNGKISFSLKNQKYTLSDGQVKKMRANYSREKVYSKTDAEKIINTVLAEQFDFGEQYAEIKNKTREEAIEVLWRGLNGAGGSQGKVAFAVADYIIENAVMQNIYDDVDNDIHIETIEVLKPYLHSINLAWYNYFLFAYALMHKHWETYLRSSLLFGKIKRILFIYNIKMNKKTNFLQFNYRKIIC